MIGNDIKAVRVAATGDAYAAPGRIVGVHVLYDGVGAGRLTVTDGNGGTTVLDLDFEATADSSDVTIPQAGIRCESTIYVSALTNITAATIFYTG